MCDLGPLRTLWQVSTRFPFDSEATEMGIHKTKEYEIMKPPVQHESGNSTA
jgi:hypothetical protein